MIRFWKTIPNHTYGFNSVHEQQQVFLTRYLVILHGVHDRKSWKITLVIHACALLYMGQPIAICDRILENSSKSHIPIFISIFTIAIL